MRHERLETAGVATAWWYQKGNREVGPISGDKLRELVDSGEIKAQDLVKRDQDTGWTLASKVRGLVFFHEDNITPTSPEESPSGTRPGGPMRQPRQSPNGNTTRRPLFPSTLAEQVGLDAGRYKEAASTSTPQKTSSIAEDIEGLHRLRKSGAISETEFQAAKSRLLGVATPADNEESSRRWACLLHLSNYLADILPLFGLLAPFLVWQWARRDCPSLDEHAKAVWRWWQWNLFAFVEITISLGALLMTGGEIGGGGFAFAIWVLLGWLAISAIVRPGLAAYRALDGQWCD